VAGSAAARRSRPQAGNELLGRACLLQLVQYSLLPLHFSLDDWFGRVYAEGAESVDDLRVCDVLERSIHPAGSGVNSTGRRNSGV